MATKIEEKKRSDSMLEFKWLFVAWDCVYVWKDKKIVCVIYDCQKHLQKCHADETAIQIMANWRFFGNQTIGCEGFFVVRVRGKSNRKCFTVSIMAVRLAVPVSIVLNNPQHKALHVRTNIHSRTHTRAYVPAQSIASDILFVVRRKCTHTCIEIKKTLWGLPVGQVLWTFTIAVSHLGSQ